MLQLLSCLGIKSFKQRELDSRIPQTRSVINSDRLAALLAYLFRQFILTDDCRVPTIIVNLNN